MDPAEEVPLLAGGFLNPFAAPVRLRRQEPSHLHKLLTVSQGLAVRRLGKASTARPSF